jgi:putative cell wall-binding protein
MKRLIVALMVVGLLLSLVPGEAGALSGGDGVVTRISGTNRYATAAAISAFSRAYSGYAVLARGDHYADALAGVPLAAAYQAPILLTPVNSLAPETRAELQELDVHTVFILGGTAAVGQAVEDELVEMGLTVERIKGANRFATATAIAGWVAPSGSYSAVVASGMDYPDALAAASYAGSLGYPILLVEKDRVPADTAAALEELGVAETILVGGSAVVSDAVMDKLPGAVRVRGKDRFETSVALAQHFGPNLDSIFVASGRGFADAITGAALAARLGSGLLLVDKNVSGAVADYLSSNEVGSVHILGGTGAVDEAVESVLMDIISVVGKMVEFLSSGVMTSAPGGGTELRYPYAGYVTKVLAVSGDYVQIQFGRRTGWVNRELVELTDRDEDYPRVGWQFSRRTDFSYIEKSPDISGYNVYAPVMYGVGSSSLSTLVNFSENISVARANGYQVWLTVQQFGTSPNFSDKIVDGIIGKALELDVDGINIDFEGLGAANRDGFTNFMARLYPKAKELGFTVSLDVSRHSNNNYGLSYDRAALAAVCDYMALMAYDQHWSTSPVAGSTATMTWTDSAIRLLLNEVPAEKVLLGIPFYTRNWRYNESIVATEDLVVMKEVMRLRTEPSTAGGSGTVIRLGQIGETFTCLGEVEGEVIEGESMWYMIDVDGQVGYVSGYPEYTRLIAAGETYGGTGLSSSALPLQAALDIYASFDSAARTAQYMTAGGTLVQMRMVEIIYDEASGQKMVSYVDDQNRLNEIWLEDYDSLRRRAAFVDLYNLGGLAAWSLEWLDAEQQAWNMLRN